MNFCTVTDVSPIRSGGDEVVYEEAKTLSLNPGTSRVQNSLQVMD